MYINLNMKYKIELSNNNKKNNIIIILINSRLINFVNR